MITGTDITRARRRAKRSQRDVGARCAELAPAASAESWTQTINRWERGTREPPARSRSIIAAAAGIGDGALATFEAAIVAAVHAHGAHVVAVALRSRAADLDGGAP